MKSHTHPHVATYTYTFTPRSTIRLFGPFVRPVCSARLFGKFRALRAFYSYNFRLLNIIHYCLAIDSKCRISHIRSRRYRRRKHLPVDWELSFRILRFFGGRYGVRRHTRPAPPIGGPPPIRLRGRAIAHAQYARLFDYLHIRNGALRLPPARFAAPYGLASFACLPLASPPPTASPHSPASPP